MGMSAWAHTPFISGIAHLSDAGLDQTGSFVWFWLYMYMYMYNMYMYMYMYTLYMLHVVSFGFGFIEPATSPKGLLLVYSFGRPLLRCGLSDLLRGGVELSR